MKSFPKVAKGPFNTLLPLCCVCINPMEFRESRLPKASKQLRVLQKVKEMSGWAKKKGKSMGVAAHFSYKSYAAAVIEVDNKDGLKVTSAVRLYKLFVRPLLEFGGQFLVYTKVKLRNSKNSKQML